MPITASVNVCPILDVNYKFVNYICVELTVGPIKLTNCIFYDVQVTVHRDKFL